MKERLTWEEMVQRYPNKWVFVENAELRGIDIISGDLICACTDDEYSKKAVELIRAGIDFRHVRTTEGNWGGYVNAKNVKISIGQQVRQAAI